MPASPLAVWFVAGSPVRLVRDGIRFRVIGEPKCADINGTRFWRVRARSESGQDVTLDLRETANGSDQWVIDGADDPSDDLIVDGGLSSTTTRAGVTR